MKNEQRNVIDAHVGARVRIRRLEQKLSQETLGKELGLTFQQVQKYEKGTNRVSASVMWDLCRILAVQPNYFYEGLTRTGKVSDKTVDSVKEFALTRDGQRIVRAFAAIKKPDVRRAVADFVNELGAVA